MTQKKMPIGRRFKKGGVGNPKGGGAHNKAIKALRRMTNDQFADIATIVLEGNVDDLRAIIGDPLATVAKKIIASALIKSMARGDIAQLDVIMNRVAGRPKNEVEIGLKDDLQKITFEIVNAKKD